MQFSIGIDAQSLAVKRAQVAFHNFASMGEPEKALGKYTEENRRRGALLRAHLDATTRLTPFLEVGANVGHTSYLFANEFGADGFALDISEDALRFGQALPGIWGWQRRPVLVAGDALRLPFRDNSLRFVATFQTLSQFRDIDAVLREVSRVLRPGGLFFLAEEPIRRRLSLRLRRVPYMDQMSRWERAFHRRGLLDFIARDVIGAEQEESFGIRQNHRYGLGAWRRLLERYFADVRMTTFAREQGWANEVSARTIRRFASDAAVASLLGGTLVAFCRKAGGTAQEGDMDLRDCLACPDCGGGLHGDLAGELLCRACGFDAVNRDGVSNLLPRSLRDELFPREWRPDTLDFSKPEHEQGLLGGFHELEGEHGAKFRWMGERASVRLEPTRPGGQVLRVRGFAHPEQFQHGRPALRLIVNGRDMGMHPIRRQGLFVVETEVPEQGNYVVEIHGRPVWRPAGEDRDFTVNLSMIRLLPRE